MRRPAPCALKVRGANGLVGGLAAGTFPCSLAGWLAIQHPARLAGLIDLRVDALHTASANHLTLAACPPTHTYNNRPDRACPMPCLCAPRPAEQDVTAAARDLVELVKHLCLVARDPRSAVFVMELFRGSPTARNKAAVGLAHTWLEEQ